MGRPWRPRLAVEHDMAPRLRWAFADIERGPCARTEPVDTLANLALEHVHRPLFGTGHFVIPSLDGRETELDPLTVDRVTPLQGRDF